MDKLHCVNCDAPIPAKNVNIQTMMAVCEQCDTVFKFDESVVSKAKRAKLKAPPNFTVTEDEDSLEISYLYREHLGAGEMAVMFFAAIGLLVSGFVVIAAKGILAPTLIMGAVALFCIYLLAAFIFDRAHITIDDDTISHIEKPIYGFSNRTFDRDEVEKVYCKPVDANQLNNSDAYYSVVLAMADGSEGKLIQYTQRNIAFYIERMLNQRLNADAALQYAEPDAASLESAEDEISLDDLLIGDDGEVLSRSNHT